MANMILIHFNDDGTRNAALVENVHFTLKRFDENGEERDERYWTKKGEEAPAPVPIDNDGKPLDLDYYTEVSEEDFQLYLGNNDDHVEYRYDKATGRPVPPPPPTDEEKLAAAQQTAIGTLKEKRAEAKAAPILTEKGLFDADENSLSNISLAKEALTESGGTMVWTLADNTTAEVNAKDLQAVISAAAARNNEAAAVYRDTKAAVLAAKTAEEVKGIMNE